jgi:hypothetical protein
VRFDVVDNFTMNYKTIAIQSTAELFHFPHKPYTIPSLRLLLDEKARLAFLSFMVTDPGFQLLSERLNDIHVESIAAIKNIKNLESFYQTNDSTPVGFENMLPDLLDEFSRKYPSKKPTKTDLLIVYTIIMNNRKHNSGTDPQPIDRYVALKRFETMTYPIMKIFKKNDVTLSEILLLYSYGLQTKAQVSNSNDWLTGLLRGWVSTINVLNTISLLDESELLLFSKLSAAEKNSWVVGQARHPWCSTDTLISFILHTETFPNQLHLL